MPPTQTITQTDLYSQIQEIVSSDLTWGKLTLSQKTLFGNPLLLASLNVKSNQEAFSLLRSNPDALSPKNEEPKFETGSTVDAALLEDLVNQMNKEEVDSDLRAGLEKYSLDQQKLIEKMVNISRDRIRLEQIQKNQQKALTQFKPEVDNLDTKQDPRQDLVKTATQIIKSSNNKLTPAQQTAAVKTLISISLASQLDMADPQDLGLAVDIALDKNELYQEVEKAVTLATNEDYKQAILTPTPNTIIDPQTNIKVSLFKLPPPEKIDVATVAKASQRRVDNLVKASSGKDITDVSEPLVSGAKKLHAIDDNPEAIAISGTLVTQVSNQQLNELIPAINQIDPTVLRLPTQPGEQAAEVLNEITPANPKLSSKTVKLKALGLDSKQWTNIYKNAKIQKMVSPQQAYSTQQQLKSLDNSQLGKEITQPLGKASRGFQNLTNKLSGKLPKGFTKSLNFVLHPVQSAKGWLGKKAGQYIGKKIYKAFAKKITNKTARLVARTLLKEGVKTGAKTLIKLGLKGGLQLAAQAANAIPGLGIILAIGIEVGSFVLKKTVGAIQSVAQSVFGEKIKARDFLALPIAAVATTGAILGGLGAVTVAAASSAVGVVAASIAAGVFLYITAFTVAPLISTIAQLESQPGVNYVITSPTGPIPPGCPSGWPTTSGRITQGPKTSSSHYGVEAIDIGVGFGTPIFSTHPGKAIAVGSSGPYGNYVDVYGVCQGVAFVTRYAHMPSVPFYGERVVAAGDQIGVVDSTGKKANGQSSSTGNHLHYEIRGGALGSINQFLPTPVAPGCIEYSQCQVTVQ
jgi:murein DD-endopeptidase MepM/ murein hydrolase activator NlpD